MSAVAFRAWTLALLALLVLALAGRLAVAIYDEAHPRDIQVWCDGGGVNKEGDAYYNRTYEGPADLVLGACQMAAGTNNP